MNKFAKLLTIVLNVNDRFSLCFKNTCPVLYKWNVLLL